MISTTGVGASRAFSALITDSIPNLHLMDTGQCFPRYYYTKADGAQDLYSGPDDQGYIRTDAITDQTLTRYRDRYGTDLDKDDIFYYVYGILHSPQYTSRYAGDLKKRIPRIPMVEDFHGFSQAGRDLAQWHLNYETVNPWPLTGTPDCDMPAEGLRITKMRFGKTGDAVDRSTIIYNSAITLTGIPPETYDYTVNGKPALEWIMDRYQIKTDKASGILNEPNLYSDDPRYILDLIGRITRVSVETAQIISKLPATTDKTAHGDAGRP